MKGKIVAAAAVLALAITGCGSTQMWPMDGQAGDAIPDPTRDPRTDEPDVPADTADAPVDTADAPTDPDVDEVRPDLPEDACATICAYLEGCGRNTTGCAEFCDRMSDAVRWCLLDAAATLSCDGIDACYTDVEPPPECDPVCEFAQSCTIIMPVDVCEDGCSVMSGELVECANAALEEGNCQDLLDCLLYPGGLEEQCDAVCDFAIVDCALDIGGVSPELCSIGCQSGFLLEEGLIDCLSYASMLRTCILLAGCVALLPPTAP